jgi:DNA-binding CsgD family transcriptional regulator
LAGLTRREQEVVAAIVSGHVTMGMLAEKMMVSGRTIQTHLTNIYQKLGAVNMVDLVLIAVGLQVARRTTGGAMQGREGYVDVPADDQARMALRAALDLLRECKPGDRSERDRAYAVAITDLQKAVAFFEMVVIRGDGGGASAVASVTQAEGA